MFPCYWTRFEPMFKTIWGRVPKALQAVFAGNARGEILMVHSTGVYFTLSDAVYLLCAKECGTVPIGVGIPDFHRTVEALDLAQGQKISLADHILTISGRKFLLQLSNYDEKTEQCTPNPGKCMQAAKILTACGKRTGLSGLSGSLLQGEPLDTLPGTLCTHAQPMVSVLLQGIMEEKQEQIVAGVVDLLGLGVGLTPSGDDVLMGLIYGLQRSAYADSLQLQWLTKAVRSQAPLRTNRISNAYLQAICSGLPFERMEQAWFGLDSRYPPAEENLLAIGSNSGSEMLLGLLLAANCVENKTVF